jgi:hypothetical protein
VCEGAGHFSYPGTFQLGERTYLIPEVAEWSKPRVFALDGDCATELSPLKIDTSAGILDPTVVEHRGTVFLFGNLLGKPDVLRLWFAETLFADFVEHPQSPIRMSPLGSRMAGAIFRQDGFLYRLGQNCVRDYGTGVVAFRIESLTRTTYAESQTGEVSFADVRGPHTLNFSDNTAIFDFYEERTSISAGLRRYRARQSKRHALRQALRDTRAPSAESSSSPASLMLA